MDGNERDLEKVATINFIYYFKKVWFFMNLNFTYS